MCKSINDGGNQMSLGGVLLMQTKATAHLRAFLASRWRRGQEYRPRNSNRIVRVE